MVYSAIFSERFNFRRGYFMAKLGDYVEPKINIGSILVLITMIGGAVTFVISDNATQMQNKDTLAHVVTGVDDLRIQMPLTRKDIEVNGNRITQLELQEREVTQEIGQLNEFAAITKQTIDDLKSQYNQLVTASQIQGIAPPPRRH